MNDFLFDLSGGALTLDFVNTVSDRPLESPAEHIQSYRDLVSWSQQTELITNEHAEQLLHTAEKHVENAQAIRDRAVVLREALYRVLHAQLDQQEAVEADIEVLNTELAHAASHLHLEPDHGEIGWCWTLHDQERLDVLLWLIVRSAADFLTSSQTQQLRLCAANDCGWLFLDTSKNHSRRWCNMKVCGNRAKVRKHHARKKQGEE